VNITAIPARTPAEAAQYYPAIYWYSMLKIPSADQFNAHAAGIGCRHDADRVAQSDEEQRLRRLPPAWPEGHPHVPARICDPGDTGSDLGAPGSVRPGRPAHDSAALEHGNVAVRNLADWTDRIGKASFPRPCRSGLRASSATSS
jgi:hypothetical protein